MYATTPLVWAEVGGKLPKNSYSGIHIKNLLVLDPQLSTFMPCSEG